jgi:hypothetical protein
LENFVKFEANLFGKIDDMLGSHQYIYLYGRSGSGKSTTANEYAYYKKEQPNGNDYSVQFINCSSSLVNNLINFKTRLGISTNNENMSTKISEEADGKQITTSADVDNLLEQVKYKINTYERNFIFILDNVGKLDDVQTLLHNINPRHKFIITTKNQQLFANSEKCGIEIKSFNEENCFEYLVKCEMGNELRDEDEWRKVLVNSQTKSIFVLPKSLELLVNNYKDHPEWKMTELRRFLLNESNTRYALLKEENLSGFEVLKHLAYLNGSSIDLVLIEDLLKEKLSGEEFGIAMNKLLKNTYLKKKCDVNSKKSSMKCTKVRKQRLGRF